VIPQLRDWHAKYQAKGLTIVGVHSPEFSWEKPYDKVVAATRELGVAYPVVQDNDFVIWKRFRQPLLARRGHRGQEGHHPIHPYRRGQLRRDGAPDPDAARGAVKRRELLLFGAVFLASAILAVLAALSLRQWEASASATCASRPATWRP
jgi:hypothetical protein